MKSSRSGHSSPAPRLVQLVPLSSLTSAPRYVRHGTTLQVPGPYSRHTWQPVLVIALVPILQERRLALHLSFCHSGLDGFFGPPHLIFTLQEGNIGPRRLIYLSQLTLPMARQVLSCLVGHSSPKLKASPSCHSSVQVNRDRKSLSPKSQAQKQRAEASLAQCPGTDWQWGTQFNLLISFPAFLFPVLFNYRQRWFLFQ